jgi:hypothetical protein
MKYKDSSPSKTNLGGDTLQNIGVYALRIKVKQEEYKHELQRFLVNAKEACYHNAEVCRSLGENEKTDVWEVLADVVQSQLENTTCNDYDGWSTTMRNGALGRGLVESFLKYYQSSGDVQMLATIVCILRSHIYQNIGTSTNGVGNKVESLLPDDDAKYDSYIRRYSDLLYGWGLLNIRAELCKHLFQTTMSLPDNFWEKSSCLVLDEKGDKILNNKNNTPGIAFVFRCARCDADTDIGSNYCRSCQDYAFRCSICDLSVRGLFTVCTLYVILAVFWGGLLVVSHPFFVYCLFRIVHYIGLWILRYKFFIHSLDVTTVVTSNISKTGLHSTKHVQLDVVVCVLLAH